jgi:hypothetical protein
VKTKHLALESTFPTIGFQERKVLLTVLYELKKQAAQVFDQFVLCGFATPPISNIKW